ncbi:flavin reductase family protein [Persicobacter diffluens]|uniref:Flavin reductase n=1 Tax=Persicobacter diffluens TaxID=981 RepID=A0AAN5AKN5_9BACT|nr:flavin reductase [Persicobacter diffluens]
MIPLKTFSPITGQTAAFHKLMLSAVAPRPIAFVSTVDEEGKVNLSPFSFFNAFSSNPPILVFSPARRVRDNTTKHTLENVLKVPECVIHIVDFAIVEQMSLSSTEYEEGVNEFIKSGLTEQPSEVVKPPRVMEAPVAFECKVREVISLGDNGGAGNMVVCEVLKMHVRENIMRNGTIDPVLLDPVARMGGNWYARLTEESLFEIPKPLSRKGIGVDQLPEAIRESNVLTGNNLARLANVEEMPVSQLAFLEKYAKTIEKIKGKHHGEERQDVIHSLAKKLLERGDVEEAWQVLLAD